MKGKAFSLVMIVSLLASMVLIGSGMAAYQEGADATFKLKLPNGAHYMEVRPWLGEHPTVNENFNLTVEILNVTEIAAFGVTLLWNSSMVEYTGTHGTLPILDRCWEGDVFADAPGAVKSALFAERIEENIEVLGTPTNYGILEGCGQSLMAAGYKYNKTGDWALFTIEFKVKSFGGIGFYMWKTSGCKEDVYPPGVATTSGWEDPVGDQPYDILWAIPCPDPNCINALLIVYPPPPYPPEAVKTLSPAFPKVGETVTATVTQTKAGFNGASMCPITETTIDWGDTTAPETYTGSLPHSFTHNYTAAGDYTVQVDCYAAGMPTGLEWCNLTNPIKVIEVPKTGIDVYQVRPEGNEGEGPDVPGRPYDPQSLVTLEAWVFYGGDAVQAKIVAFEVVFGQECILYRTDYTDEFGIASIQFRIPTLCWPEGPESLFGKWDVFVDVEIAEVKYNDTMQFDVGYLITLSNMVSVKSCTDQTAEDVFKKLEVVAFNVTITNIDWVWYSPVIILVVYDENQVPIGQEIIQTDVPPGEFCNPSVVTMCISLLIPKWAFVGAGVGYINAFTAIPSECGLAWCPEVSDGILIVKAA